MTEFVIVGAGAVGCVVGTLLEADGHAVRYLAKPGQLTASHTLRVDRIDGPSLRSAPLRYVHAAEPATVVDWVVVCVRGEQLDAAFRDVAERLGRTRSVAVAAVSLDSVVERARRAGLTGDVLAYHVSFGSFRDPQQPERFAWFPFAVPSTITPEGDRKLLGRARELGQLLDHAGLATRALLSMRGMMQALVALNSVLALGWALCDWDLKRLVRHAELRRHTAAALAETLQLLMARSAWRRVLSGLLPVVFYGLVLRVLAQFMGSAGREAWRYHGPKITQQTAYIVRELLARGSSHSRPMFELRGLFTRWQTAQGLDQPGLGGTL